MKQVIFFGLFVSLMLGSIGFSSAPPAQAKSGENISYQTGNTSIASPTATIAQTVAPSQVALLDASATLTPTVAPANTIQPTRATYERPLVNLVTNSYDAGKTYAGNKFSLSAKFKNQGQKTAYNIIVTFSGADVQPQSNGGVIMISSLAPDEAVTVTQDLLIKSSVSVYQTSIDEVVEYKDENGASFTQKFSAAINVYWYLKATSTLTPTATPVGRPRVVVSSYSLENPILQPGTTFSLSLNIEDLGTNDAHTITLTIGGGSTGTTTTTSFLPVGTSNIRVLGDLAAQKGLQLQQSLIVNSSTTPGAYPLTLNFAYRDDSGVNYTEEQIITLLVYMVPSIEVGFYETPETFTVGQKANLPIQVVNLNSSSVLLGDITVSMESATLANNQLFVGTVDGGGSFTMDTDMTPLKGGEQTLKVSIAYQDNFKNPQVISKSITINVVGQTAGGPSQTLPGQLATQVAARGSQTPSGSQANGDWWQIVMRFVRGMIGFDSAPDRTTTAPFGFPAPVVNATPTPGR